MPQIVLTQIASANVDSSDFYKVTSLDGPAVSLVTSSSGLAYYPNKFKYKSGVGTIIPRVPTNDIFSARAAWLYPYNNGVVMDIFRIMSISRDINDVWSLRSFNFNNPINEATTITINGNATSATTVTVLSGISSAYVPYGFNQTSQSDFLLTFSDSATNNSHIYSSSAKVGEINNGYGYSPFYYTENSINYVMVHGYTLNETLTGYGSASVSGNVIVLTPNVGSAWNNEAIFNLSMFKNVVPWGTTGYMYEIEACANSSKIEAVFNTRAATSAITFNLAKKYTYTRQDQNFTTGSQHIELINISGRPQFFLTDTIKASAGASFGTGRVTYVTFNSATNLWEDTILLSGIGVFNAFNQRTLSMNFTTSTSSNAGTLTLVAPGIVLGYNVSFKEVASAPSTQVSAAANTFLNKISFKKGIPSVSLSTNVGVVLSSSKSLIEREFPAVTPLNLSTGTIEPALNGNQIVYMPSIDINLDAVEFDFNYTTFRIPITPVTLQIDNGDTGSKLKYKLGLDSNEIVASAESFRTKNYTRISDTVQISANFVSALDSRVFYTRGISSVVVDSKIKNVFNKTKRRQTYRSEGS